MASPPDTGISTNSQSWLYEGLTLLKLTTIAGFIGRKRLKFEKDTSQITNYQEK